MNSEKICLISFSNNADYQNIIYGMFYALQGKVNVYTIGIENPKCRNAPQTNNNFYYNCPLRPGIGKGAFRFGELFKMARMIRKEHIRYLYFESLHLWNVFLMALCPHCYKIEAIHDVIPHDNNRAMALCNYVTSYMANSVILRNSKYKDILAKNYRLSTNKIVSFELWKNFPPEIPMRHTGNFLCFGRIRRYKGLDQLLQIIKKTPEIQYQIVGDPDEESVALLEQIKQCKNVKITDREVSEFEMEEAFYDADWIVLPYLSATQSGVILDACRFSRPVIAFNVGAISEQVRDKESGFLVPQGDINAFAEAVIKASQMSKKEKEAFAHAAYQFGYEKYAVESAADRFLDTVLKMKS